MVKKIHPKFFGKILNGRATMYPTDKEYYDGYIHTFREEQEIEITIKNKFKKRTSKQPDEETNQNGYYWGIPMRMIMDELGDQFTKQELHDWIQIKVGNTVMMPDQTEIPKGTSEMPAGEFEEYCSKVRMWCAVPGNLCEDGMYIPEPYEAEYDE